MNQEWPSRYRLGTGREEEMSPQDGSAKVTAYFPHPGGSDSQAEREIASEILSALQRVADHGLKGIVSRDLARELKPMSRDSNFDTLCVFLSQEGLSLRKYDRPVAPTVAVDDTFFLKPIASSLTGADQFMVLRSTAHDLELYLGDLMGQRLLAVIRGEGAAAVARRETLLRFALRSKLPIFLAGKAEIGEVPHGELIAEDGAVPEKEFQRLLDEARRRLKERQNARTESLLQKLASGQLSSHTTIALVEDSVRNGNSHELLVEAGEWNASGKPAKVDRRNAPSVFQLDDVVEHAIRKRLRVTPVYGLQERLGTSQISVLDVLA